MKRTDRRDKATRTGTKSWTQRMINKHATPPGGKDNSRWPESRVIDRYDRKG